jgi:integrase
MAVAFTDTMIRSAEAPAGGRLEITDARCPGLVLRVTDKGVKTFAFKYWSTAQRKAVRLTLGKYPDLTLAGARRQAEVRRHASEDGRDPHAEKSAGVAEARGAATFDEAADLFMNEYSKPRKASWKGDAHYLKHVRAKWKGRRADSITDDDAAELLDGIAAGSPVNANRTQSLLHKMFAWLKEPGRKVVKVNPLAGMPRRGKEVPKDRVLTDAELRTFWRGLDDPELPAERPVALALRFILLTMARPGEAAGALRDELRGLEDGEDAEWHLPATRTKNRRAHIIPLSSSAKSIIFEAMPEGCPVVFRSVFEARASVARNSLSQALTEIRTHLKLAHFTPHDLRRTAATIARRAGAPRSDVKAMLNHAERDVTGVYDLYEMLAEKRGVAAILGSEIIRLTR